jgi:hypothetical protein
MKNENVEIESNPKIGHQIELETLYNKNQLLGRLRREFTDAKEVNFCKYMEEQGIDCEFGLSLLVHMVLHKRTTLTTLVGLLRHHFPGNTQKVADELLKCAHADLVTWNNVTGQFVIQFDITPDTQAELEKYQYPLPMVIEPREIKSNTDSPYVICRDGSVILRNNHHNDDICLDHVNRMNKIKFCIDTNTATMVRNKWRNLDKPKAGETKQDFDKRKRAFEKYDRTSKQVMGEITKLDNEFYLTHKYDKRGRVYCQGYHVSYQGAAWNKSVIQLADKEVIP